MATAPDFNLNSPYTLDELSASILQNSGYEVGSDEYKSLNSSLLYDMWRNKAVSELYEPGSTYKIVTASMGIELGSTTYNDHSFSCPGYHIVGGARIGCWRPQGHGSGITFAYGLQQSCNPTLMQLAARIGSENFYNYFKAFGYLSKTGIDLPSESQTIFHTEKGLGTVELATASFGQRFKVTPIQQLTAIAAVANGGYLVTPHLIDSLIDNEGNTVYQYKTEVKRQVISEESAKIVSEILEEGVSGTGASKNAYVAGYRIAAKTGTSEKLDKPDKNGNYTLRIGSCVAYAPYVNTSIAVIIMVDEPIVNYYGATVAAPYMSDLLTKVLPYLGYEPSYTDEQLNSLSVRIGNYVGKTVKEAKRMLSSIGISADALGADENAVITAQSPKPSSTLTKNMGSVILYTDYSNTETTTVPDVLGKSVTEANQILISRGLNIKIEGAKNYAISDTVYAKATYQSVAAGSSVDKGSVITVRFLYDDRD
jgi:stage V sporulation protein D (sporulation-specific penicillin-binding protein)